jgi:MYXO-CTERM domain-containing protein
VHYIELVKRASFFLLVLGALSIPQLASAAPGELRAVGIGTQGNNYGYWEYLPSAYDEEEEWPLFVFLGGVGEVGTGVDDTPCEYPPQQPDFQGGSGLCNHLRHGPQRLIYQTLYEGDELWDDTERPFVVIAPQNPLIFSPYDPGALFDFFDYLEGTYSLDSRRLYLVGMSEGGHTIATYLMTDPDRLAAVSVLAGFVNDEPMMNACDLNHQAIWMFHGEDDLDFHVDNPIAFWNNLNDCPPPHAPARLTVYLGAQHDVWTRTINPAIGMDDVQDPAYDPYDVDLYSWLLSIDKPFVDAGPDVVGDEDDDVIALSATVIDDDVISWEWTQIEGDAVTLVGGDTAAPGITDASAGVVAFRVRAVDADGQYDEDEVTVTIEPGDGVAEEEDEGDDAGPTDDGGGTQGEGGSETGDCTDAGGDDDDDGETTGGGDEGPTTVGDSDDDGVDDGVGDDESDDCGDGHGDGDDSSGSLTCECNTSSNSSPAALGLLVLALAARRRRKR